MCCDLSDYERVDDLKIIQKLLLSILIDFHKVCEENDLTYNLCGGTLLGAVRHKGFIPWDDDVDVCMPRDDLNKFVDIVRNLNNCDYECFVPGDKNYFHPFVKLCIRGTYVFETGVKKKYSVYGLWIDIFPMDNFPDDNVIDCYSFFEKFNVLMSKIGYSVKKWSNTNRTGWLHFVKAIDPVRGFKFLYYGLKGFKRYLAEFVKLQQQFNGINTERITYYFLSPFDVVVDKKVYYDRVLYDFEGFRFYGVRNYDLCLTQEYGDYMTPPLPEKRVQSHGFELYVKKYLLKRIVG